MLSHSVLSDSLWPCGLWPARLLCPWDSLGKNTRVACHALLQRILWTQGWNPHLISPALAGRIFFFFLPLVPIWKWSEVAQSFPALCDPMDCSLPGSSIHGIFQAKVLEWVAISFSRGIFLTQELNLGLLHCRQVLYHLSHQGVPLGSSRIICNT